MPNSTKTLSISLHSLDVSVRQCIYLLPGQLLRPRLLYNSTRRNPRLINRSLVIPGWVSLSMDSSPTWAYVSSPRPRTRSISVSRALQSPPTPLKHHVCWPVFTQKSSPNEFCLVDMTRWTFLCTTFIWNLKYMYILNEGFVYTMNMYICKKFSFDFVWNDFLGDIWNISSQTLFISDINSRSADHLLSTCVLVIVWKE